MNNATKHNENCKRVFKNYDVDCPRCQELANGQAPRDGWQKSYYAQRAIAARPHVVHACSNRCSPVCCTFGDW